MIVVKKNYPKPDKQVTFPILDNVQTVFLDIETTGFHRTYTYVMLIGVMAVRENDLELIQWFAQGPDDEPELLNALDEYLREPCHIITFNGDRFDRPYLEARTKHHLLPYQYTKHMWTDLLSWAKHIELDTLENRKLKTIESLLGINRTDTISGKESIEDYKLYLKSPDDALLKKILLHNADDIVNMYPLWRLHQYLAPKDQLSLTPRLSMNRQFIYVLKIDGHRICINGLSDHPLKSHTSFGDHEIVTSDHQFSINLLTVKLPHPRMDVLLVHLPTLEQVLPVRIKPKNCQVIINDMLQLANIEEIILEILKTVQ